ncbi:MAG: ATP-binding protein [Gordonia sp. (in: high G+C Gram-positive bacteria)]
MTPESGLSTGAVEHSRITAVMARFVGTGFLAYLLIALPVLNKPPGMVAGWFTPVGMLLGYGPGFALLAVTFVPSIRDRWIPRLALLVTPAYLAACGVWFLAWTGSVQSSELVCWLFNFCGMPAMALALARSLRETAVVLLICSVVAGLLTSMAREPLHGSSNLAVDLLWSFLFTLPFALGVRMVVRSGALLDASRADAVRVAGDSAAAIARNAERGRFDALIHDHVIATLASAKSHPDDDRLPGQARRALAEMDAVSEAPLSDEAVPPLPAAEAVARLRTAVHAVDVDVTVAVEQPDDDVRYPAGVVRAMSEALGEALRNSVRHAGAGAERMVLLAGSRDALRVTVVDDGVGFRPAAVPPERLGIAVSIRQRLEAQPGGSATVTSEPGRGAVVALRWERPA